MGLNLWIELYKSKIGDKERKFDIHNIPGCCPKVPQQDNSSDCGVYLLQYIESFFENPLDTYELPYFETIETPEQWFLTSSVKRKRKSIAKVIRHLTVEQNQGKEYVFPKLEFGNSGITKRNSEREPEEQKMKSSLVSQLNVSIVKPENYSPITNLAPEANPKCTMYTGENLSKRERAIYIYTK